MKMCDGRHELLAGKVKRLVELIPRVGANLVGVHPRLLLVIPVLSEIAVFSVAVTKPNRI